MPFASFYSCNSNLQSRSGIFLNTYVPSPVRGGYYETLVDTGARREDSYSRLRQRQTIVILVLVGTIPVPHSKAKRSPAERRGKRYLVRRGATIFTKEVVEGN